MQTNGKPPLRSIQVIDSHTGGEPTRIIVDWDVDLGSGPLHERLAIFRDRHDEIRSAVVNEPRGCDVIVGGLLCEPHDPTCAFGILFFNNVDFLGMCGHGTVGLIKTLEHMGRLQPGTHRIDTPVGPVEAVLESDGRVSVFNVPSYRHLTDVRVEVPSYGTVVGDVAYGGNWFFLVKEGPAEVLDVTNAEHLTRVTKQIRDALQAGGVTGAQGAYIDHVELFSAPEDENNDSRNFVLCPGGAYDRSPCGTGSSAKLACLAADGKLAPGKVWRQESVIGSVFDCSYAAGQDAKHILPKITGSAFVCAESRLLLDPQDPFCMGIRS